MIFYYSNYDDIYDKKIYVKSNSRNNKKNYVLLYKTNFTIYA
jgi:hypothetical protein